MEPRVTKRDKKLHLNYELPHRVHCSQIYPTPAPNGSSVIVYGHERGVRIVWRGGRRRRKQSVPPQTNGVSQNDIIVIDDTNDEGGDGQKQPQGQDQEYEDEEDEQDPDCPYPSIIQDLDVELESAALHLAIPAIPSSHPPKLTSTHALVVATCANGAVTALSIALAAPEKPQVSAGNVSRVDLPSLSEPACALAAKLVSVDEDEPIQNRAKGRGQRPEAELIIAAASSSLHIWAVDVTATALKKRRAPLICTAPYSSPASSITFNVSSRSTQLLLSDASGAVRIYDPYGLETPDGHLAGKWVTSYFAPYHSRATSGSSPARRKRVLSCTWVLGGRGALALLEDGEWGIWNLTGTAQPGKDVGDFAVSVFLPTAGGETTEAVKPKQSTKLAPMTPNTRKAKSDSLFAGSSKASGVAPTGGISSAPNHNKSGQSDESVVMWYGSDIYSITSTQSFWQRSTSNSGSFGSLYAPGLAHNSDINLMNEHITSVSQLPTQTSSIGQMNTQRDLVVSVEHRLIIPQTLRSSAPTRQLFEQAAQRPVSRDRDQRMLDTGDLDLGGLNRMLESRTEEARPRKVGFAAS